MNTELKTSYLGIADLGKITPLKFGKIVNAIFITITNADHKDGFLLEYEGVSKIYEKLMTTKDGEVVEFSTKNQRFKIVTNHGYTELTIDSESSWCSSESIDIRELEEILENPIPDKWVMLVPTSILIKKLFRIITAKERNLIYFN